MKFRFLAAAVVLVALSAHGQRVRPSLDPGGPPPQRTRPSASPGLVSDWTKFGGSLGLTGTPAGVSAIDRQRAGRLALVWQIALGAPLASQPSVVGNTLYVGDWGGFERAINVATGEVRAKADLGRTHAPQCTPSLLGITSTAAVAGDRVYVAGGDNAFYALDAATLSVIWRKTLGDNTEEGGYYGWSSPALVENRVLQGVASNCDNPFVPGRLVALNRLTGEQIAVAPFVAEGQVGNGVWTSPAVDLTERKVFVTTASGLDYNTGLGYSIVRLNLDSLDVEDSWKVALGDTSWDADWGSSPTLFRDAAGDPLVGAGHKDGSYYAFSRSDLASGPVWKAPVAQKGEVPQSGDGTLSTAAFDGSRLYVGGGIPPETTDPSALGSVVAIDPSNGAILWRQTFPGPVIAPVSTVNNVVFAAGGNMVAALDALTGEILWSYRTAAAIYGGIAISGDRIFVGDVSGRLYAFRVV